MGKVHDRIEGRLRRFIEDQHVFFVATAPSRGGHVNVSPKGIGGTFTIVDERTVAYLDLTASGAETIAHLRDNGRITLMFCSFDRSPNVVRLHGHGRVVSLYEPEFARWRDRFTQTVGARAVVVVDVYRISDSCGYGVPLMTYAGERDVLPAHLERKGEEALVDYRRSRNRSSIDGLRAFDDDPMP
jgi:hypothetical protein